MKILFIDSSPIYYFLDNFYMITFFIFFSENFSRYTFFYYLFQIVEWYLLNRRPNPRCHPSMLLLVFGNLSFCSTVTTQKNVLGSFLIFLPWDFFPNDYFFYLYFVRCIKLIFIFFLQPIICVNFHTMEWELQASQECHYAILQFIYFHFWQSFLLQYCNNLKFLRNYSSNTSYLPHHLLL